jgi:hypothetical protein
MATQYINVPGFGSMVVEDTATFTHVNVPGFGSFTNPNEEVAVAAPTAVLSGPLGGPLSGVF